MPILAMSNGKLVSIILTSLEAMLAHARITVPSSGCRSDTFLVFGVPRKAHTFGRGEIFLSAVAYFGCISFQKQHVFRHFCSGMRKSLGFSLLFFCCSDLPSTGLAFRSKISVKISSSCVIFTLE